MDGETNAMSEFMFSGEDPDPPTIVSGPGGNDMTVYVTGAVLGR